MKFTLNNFYSNNYKDFIHLEALKNILRQVPQLNLAGVENIDNILSMEFSVDNWGENPMYIKYIDTDNKEHIVKIRPAVTEQIYEILKTYAKISYVDEQDKKLKDELHTEITQGDESTLNGSKEYTDTVVNSAKDELRTEITQGDESTLNGSKEYTDTVVNSAKDELHTEITQGDESTLNVSKTYTDTVVNHAKDEINHTIETTKQDLKNYCDNKCEIILASSKEYTDTKAHELSQRIDEQTNSLNNKVETVNQQVTNNSEQITAVNQLVTANDAKTTQALADVNGRIDNLPRASEVTRKGGIFKGRLNIMTDEPNDFYSNVILEQRDGTESEVVGRLVKGDVAKKADLDLLSGKVTNNSEQITAANQLITANDNKTSQALADVNSRIDNIPRASEVTRTGAKFKGRLNVEVDTPNDFYSTVTLEQRDGSDSEFVGRLVKGDVAKKADLDLLSGKVTDLSTAKDSRLSEIPKTGKATYINWYPNMNVNYVRLLADGEYTRAHIHKPDGSEQVVYLPNSKIGDKPTGTPSDIKFNNTEDVTKINFLPGNPDRVLISTAAGTKMNSAFITPAEKTNITNLLSWKTSVTDELTRMNGGITELATKQDEINHTIETTKQDLKGYCDNKCALTLASSKEYTDTKIADKTIELTSDYTQKINEVSKKVDDLDIGGTNLLWGTDTYVNDFWTLPVSNGISHGEREDDGLLSQSIHIFGDDNKAKENMATNYRPIHLIAGHQYTISLQARYYEPNRADTKVTGRNIRVFSDYTDVHEPEGFGLTTELTGEYKRYSHTFTCKQTGDYRGWRFGDWTDAVGYPGGSIYIGEIKIEEGNIPTAWRTAEGELTSRLRGKVENVPKEFFMSLNNTVLDTTSCYARLFRFTDFAIVKISCFIKGVTIEPWTYREVVSAPQAYFKDFSKFDYIKGKKEFSDLGRPYETDFNISNSKIGIYCRGTKIEKEDLSLEIAGILYN